MRNQVSRISFFPLVIAIILVFNNGRVDALPQAQVFMAYAGATAPAFYFLEQIFLNLDVILANHILQLIDQVFADLG